MLGGLWGKIAGSVIGKAIGGFFGSYGLYVAIGGVLALIVTLTIYVHGAEQAKAEVKILRAQVAGWESALATADEALKQNRVEYQACLDVNQQNADMAAFQAVQKYITQQSILRRNLESDFWVKEILNDADQAKRQRDPRDTEPRYLNDDFPDWFTDSLRGVPSSDSS